MIDEIQEVTEEVQESGVNVRVVVGGLLVAIGATAAAVYIVKRNKRKKNELESDGIFIVKNEEQDN